MTAKPFHDISMDILSALPPCDNYNALFVCVDRFSKMCKCAPISSSTSAQDLAHVFYDTVFKHHGMPTTIISDRNSKFTSHFW